jgi:hypothetical protein
MVVDQMQLLLVVCVYSDSGHALTSRETKILFPAIVTLL